MYLVSILFAHVEDSFIGISRHCGYIDADWGEITGRREAQGLMDEAAVSQDPVRVLAPSIVG